MDVQLVTKEGQSFSRSLWFYVLYYKFQYYLLLEYSYMLH
jgi:hypothetical protein